MAPELNGHRGAAVPSFTSVTSFATVARNEWENDQPLCSLCNAEFTFFNRRHHCRMCGRCVCEECSPNRMQLEGSLKGRRVCSACVQSQVGGPTSAGDLRRRARDEALVDTSSRLWNLTERMFSLLKRDAPIYASSDPVEVCITALNLLENVVPDIEQLTEKCISTQAAVDEMSKRLESLASYVAAPALKMNASSPAEDSVEACLNALSLIEAASPDIHNSPGPPIVGDTGSLVSAVDSEKWDEDTSACKICGSKLGKRHMNPRHHCRVCGKCVCSSCSPSLVKMSDGKRLERVCTPCVNSGLGALAEGGQH